MDLGFEFVTWSPLSGYVVGEVVWTGKMPVNAESDVSMPSSLCEAGSQQPSKPVRSGGSRGCRPSGVIAQSLGRA